MLKLINYRCGECSAEAHDYFEDEDAPTCCEQEMNRIRFHKGHVPRASFKLFRPYTVDKMRITSPEQELALKKSMCKKGEKPSDIHLVKESASQRRTQIEELRHEAIKKFEHRSPQIAERIKNRPMPEFTD